MMSGENSSPTPGKVIVPAMAHGGARLLAAAFRAVGIEAEITPPSDARTLELGSRYTCGDECLPAKVTIGDFMKILENPNTEPSRTILLLPSADGPCRFGQYAPYLRSVLDAAGYGGVRILSPNCDDGYASLGHVAAPFFRTAWRAAVAADLMKADADDQAVRGEARGSGPGIPGVDQNSVRRLGECADQSWPPIARPLRCAGWLPESVPPTRQAARKQAVNRHRRRDLLPANSFSNQNVIRRLETYGAEAWVAGFRGVGLGARTPKKCGCWRCGDGG